MAVAAIALPSSAHSWTFRAVDAFTVVGGTWSSHGSVLGPVFVVDAADPTLSVGVTGPRNIQFRFGIGTSVLIQGLPAGRNMGWCRSPQCEALPVGGAYQVAASSGTSTSVAIDEKSQLSTVLIDRGATVTTPTRVEAHWTASSDAKSFWVTLSAATEDKLSPIIAQRLLPGTDRSVVLDGLPLSGDTTYQLNVWGLSADLRSSSPLVGQFNISSDRLDFRAAMDTTSPLIQPTVSGRLGTDGWYRSDVSLAWSVSDAESTVLSQSGCETRTITSDTKGLAVTCQATSTGGSASKTVTVKRDVGLPVITCKAVTFVYGQPSAVVVATVTDSTSGPKASRLSKTVATTTSATSVRADPPFSGKVKFTAYDRAGNSQSKTCSYAVKSYPWAGATQLNASTSDYGYSKCPSDVSSCMTRKYVYKGVTYGEYDKWNYYFRNCTSYVAWRLAQRGISASKFVASVLRNGGQWYDNAPQLGLKRGTTPKVGAAAVSPGAVGHVAYVEAVHKDGTITVGEYNKSLNGKWGTRTGTPANLKLTKFVYF